MAREASQQAAARWRERLRRFERSGLSAARFCDAEGCSTASFYQWRKRLAAANELDAAGDAADAAGAKKFQPITVLASRPLVIELAGGTRIEVPPENLDALRAVIHELVRTERTFGPGSAPC